MKPLITESITLCIIDLHIFMKLFTSSTGKFSTKTVGISTVQCLYSVTLHFTFIFQEKAQKSPVQSHDHCDFTDVYM